MERAKEMEQIPQREEISSLDQIIVEKWSNEWFTTKYNVEAMKEVPYYEIGERLNKLFQQSLQGSLFLLCEEIEVNERRYVGKDYTLLKFPKSSVARFSDDWCGVKMGIPFGDGGHYLMEYCSEDKVKINERIAKSCKEYVCKDKWIDVFMDIPRGHVHFRSVQSARFVPEKRNESYGK